MISPVTGAIFGILLATAMPSSLTTMARLADFERMVPSAYTDMLRKAQQDYSAKSYDEAFRLFERAACGGDKQSQSVLGGMYLLGQGVKREDLVGYAWLKVASEVAFGSSRKIVAKLDGAMTPAQHQIADGLARKAIELYGLAATRTSCQMVASRSGHILDQMECVPAQQGGQVLLRKCVAGALQ